MGIIFSHTANRAGAGLEGGSVNMHYERIYNEPLGSTDSISDIRGAQQKTRTGYAGNMIEVRCYPLRCAGSAGVRAGKCKISAEKQQKLNEKNARRHAVMLINANFNAADLWGTFGWNNDTQPESIEAARRELRNFLLRLKRMRGKAGLAVPMRYMYVIEQTAAAEQPHYHIHIVMSGGLDRDSIERAWHGGAYPQVRRLMPKDFGGLTGLAIYITKQRACKRRWGQSKGLKQYSRKPTESFSRISKRAINRIASMRQRGDEYGIKEIIERAYPGYEYRAEYPAELYCSDSFGGVYLYCRLYRPLGM